MRLWYVMDTAEGFEVRRPIFETGDGISRTVEVSAVFPTSLGDARHSAQAHATALNFEEVFDAHIKRSA